MSSELISTGVYGVPEAARIIGASAPAVSRWAFGYSRHGQSYDPVIDTFLPTLDGRAAISFLELVELFTIKEFRRARVPWILIRKTFEYLAQQLETDYPFARDRWFADPAGIYHDIDGSSNLVEVSGDGQMAMKDALLPYLRQLDFDDGFARRWYPRGKHVPVVLDPEMAFGAPVVAGTGIETAVIADLHREGETAESIAWWYEIDHHSVDAAILFEESMSSAA